MLRRKPYERVPKSLVALHTAMLQKREPPELKENLRNPIDLWALLEQCWHLEPGDRPTAAQCQAFWDRLVRCLTLV